MRPANLSPGRPAYGRPAEGHSRALAALSRFYVGLNLLPSEPKDNAQPYTEEFLPK